MGSAGMSKIVTEVCRATGQGSDNTVQERRLQLSGLLAPSCVLTGSDGGPHRSRKRLQSLHWRKHLRQSERVTFTPWDYTGDRKCWQWWKLYTLERVSIEYLSDGTMSAAAVLSETISPYTVLYVLLMEPVHSCPHCPRWARGRRGARSEAASEPEAARTCRRVPSLPTRPTRCPQPWRGGSAVCRVEPACAERAELPGASSSASGPRARAGSDPSRHIPEQGQEPGAAGREPTPASRLTYSPPTTV